MSLPKLENQSRSREFSQFQRPERENIVMAYLFYGFSNRDLDMKYLCKFDSNGYCSMAILHHYGFTTEFKGIFKGMTVEEALTHIPSEKESPEYIFLTSILRRNKDFLIQTRLTDNNRLLCNSYFFENLKRLFLSKKQPIRQVYLTSFHTRL